LSPNRPFGYQWSKRMPPKKTFSCPVCDEDVPVKAKSCPHCGACAKSCWNEDSRAADGLDLPDEDFDYDKFTAEEFGTPRRAQGKQLLWKVTAIALIVLAVVLIAFKLFATLSGSPQAP
jgi:ferredoxin